MNVEIVLSESTDNRILARLALTLSEGTGWPVVSRPSGKRTAYYFPYLERRQALKGQKTVAWFTHNESDHRPRKAAIWREVASAVDLRLTSAKLNLDPLAPFGPSRYVTPPLDFAKFRPAKTTRQHTRPVIGTSGWVYPGGRKGEVLWGRLVADVEFGDCDFIAAGHGWPASVCATWPWEHLEDYYQSLDVYVCTSLVEGVGYGPMEALACGVPVVVPVGVGVFDELGERPGVYRYYPGDYDVLTTVVRQAVDERGEYQPEALRSVVGGFTVDAWVNDHVEAFQTLQPTSVAPVRATDPEATGQGVYLVAYGGPARDCARDCLRSLKRFAPELPVCLVSSAALGGEDHLVVLPEVDIGARSAKIKVDELAPPSWRDILYLDADTELLANPESLFAILADGWDLCIIPNPAQYHTAGMMARPDNKDEVTQTVALWGCEEFLQFNGGVWAYRRNERTRRFFAAWHGEWHRWAKRDQAAFDRALWTVPLKVWTVSRQYNLVDRYHTPDESTVIVHHPTRARRTSGLVYGRGDSPEAWAAIKGGKA